MVPQRDRIDILINDVLIPLAAAITIIGVVMEVAARADDQLVKGHREISATWQRILAAIERLQAEKPAPGETVQ